MRQTFCEARFSGAMVEPVLGLLLGEDIRIEHHEVLIAEKLNEAVPVSLPRQAHMEARSLRLLVTRSYIPPVNGSSLLDAAA